MKRICSHRIPIVIGLLTPRALWLYWPSLSFPLMYDTLLHTQFSDDLTLRSVWRANAGFGFYRPLVFTPMIIMRQLFGWYPPTLLHALNVGQHALNAALLAWLCWRLWGRRGAALLAGPLFACYPFAYQALAIYGNNAYLTVTGLVLLGLHAYLSYESSQKFGWLAATLALFVAGVLVHETAVMLFPLILLHRLLQPPQPKLNAFLQQLRHPSLVILLAAVLLYLTLYALLPTGSGPQLDYGGNAFWAKLLILLQAAAYPFAWFAHLLPSVSASVVVLTSVALMGLLVAWAARRGGWRPLLFGLGWWLGASLLIGLTLPTYYIADGARLLYFGGAGVALAWAAVLATAEIKSWQHWLAIAFLAFILVSSGIFVRSMLDYYAAVSQPLETMKAAVEDRPRDEALVIVNLPQWMAPPGNTYAVGTEFAPFLGDHLFAYELIKANFGEERLIYPLHLPELLSQPEGYHYGVYTSTAVPNVQTQETSRQHVFINRYAEEGVETQYTGYLAKGSWWRGVPEAQLGGYELRLATAELCGRVVNATLSLVALEEIPPTATLFVQLLSADGRLLAQADGPPLGLPPERIGDLAKVHLIDQRQLNLPEGESIPLDAFILVGLYDFTTGERFAAVDELERPLADDAFHLALTECSKT